MITVGYFGDYHTAGKTPATAVFLHLNIIAKQQADHEAKLKQQRLRQ